MMMDMDKEEEEDLNFDASLQEALEEANSFLDSDDDELEQTIQTMASTQLCVHPDHAHSFAKATMFTLALGASLRKCAGCKQALKKAPFGNSDNKEVADPSIVKCMACGTLAHRSCALSNVVTWDEVCPINGPAVKEAADALAAAVTDDDDDKNIHHKRMDTSGEEFTMELNDTDNSSNSSNNNNNNQNQEESSSRRSRRKRNDSFVSASSAESSMATQELDEMEMMEEHATNELLLGDGLTNRQDDPTSSVPTKTDAVMMTTPEKADTAIVQSEGEVGNQSPTPQKRNWFRRKSADANSPATPDNNNNSTDQDRDIQAANISSPKSNRKGWFSSSSKQTPPKTEESSSDPDAHASCEGEKHSSTPSESEHDNIPNDTAESGTTNIQSKFSLPITPVKLPPWLSPNGRTEVEEDYGDNAAQFSPPPPPHGTQQQEQESPMNDTNDANEAMDNSSQRRGWFQRRHKSKSSTAASEEDTEGKDSSEVTAPATDDGDPISTSTPSPNSNRRFGLFSRNKRTNDDNNTPPPSELQPPPPDTDPAEDMAKAEFTNFLNVDEEEEDGEGSSQEIVFEHSTPNNEMDIPTTNQEEQQLEQQDQVECALEKEQELDGSKSGRRGFGLFRRRSVNAESNTAEASSAGGGLQDDNGSDNPDLNAEPPTEEKDTIENNVDEQAEAAETDDIQSSPSPAYSRFRLFALRTGAATSPNGADETSDAHKEEEEQEEEVTFESDAPALLTKSSFSLWRKSSQTDSEQERGTNDDNHDTATSSKGDDEINEHESEKEPSDENAIQDNDAADETSPRRFFLFGKRNNEPGETDGPDGTHSNEVELDKETNENQQSSQRKFSLFGFRRGGREDAENEPENQIQQSQSWAGDAPPSHWTTATTTTFKKPPILDSDATGVKAEADVEEREPLHYANHPFASVSRALQDNILALFYGNGDVEDKESLDKDADEVDHTDSSGESSPRKPPSTLSLIVSPDSSDPSESGEAQIGLGEIRPEPVQESTLMKVASGTYEAVKATVDTKNKMGVASVAGGIAGGVAGLMFAGPAGAVMGVRYGQTAGMVGVMLEGSLTVGVIVAGVAGGRFTAEKIQEQIEEQRVLTIGEHGVARKVMLVRPTIRIDPAWKEIWAEAQRTSPVNSSSTFSLFSSVDINKQERYERTSDIVEEEEIPTNEKVLLLVSRVLSDKGSFPGHIYRALMQAFKDRCQQRLELKADLARDQQDFPHLFKGVSGDDSDSVNMGDGVKLSLSQRARREDAHGVIKYITATLLEVRPGLASTPEITETTASVVEALVFGEVYDLVYEEIAIEATEKDKRLMEKIDDFEFARLQRTGLPLCTDSLVSQDALQALRKLPDTHAAADKLRHCVSFLERISEYFASSAKKASTMGADSLLKMVCQHIIAAKMSYVNAEVAFLEEFARDEQLLRGKEGYALVTLQASLHFLNMSNDFERDIFGQDMDEENVPIVNSEDEECPENVESGKASQPSEDVCMSLAANETFARGEGSAPSNDEKETAEAESREEKKEDTEAIPDSELL